MARLRTITTWLPSTLTLAVVLYATLYPDPAGVENFPKIPHLDKLIHAIMFGGLAGAWAFDYTRSSKTNQPSFRAMCVCAFTSVILGGIIEVLQERMGLGRGCDPYDFAADTFGCLIALLTAPQAIKYVITKFNHQKRK